MSLSFCTSCEGLSLGLLICVLGSSHHRGSMEQEVVNSLLKLQLTKEEEEDILLMNVTKLEILEECSLSLFGRLLIDRQQNQRALKTTLKSAWKMGSDLRIVEVGNNILQFKFGFQCQLEWVEKGGPWNFENNLLLLCRWRKGLTATNIIFTMLLFGSKCGICHLNTCLKKQGRI